MELGEILGAYAKPDKSIVQRIKKGSSYLDYVGHAQTTAILLQIDPEWNYTINCDERGIPIVIERHYTLEMWGTITLLGHTRPCVGTCDAAKGEVVKELIGDMIRNGAMRFGIALDLWAKGELLGQPLEPVKPAKPTEKPVEKPTAVSEIYRMMGALDSAGQDALKAAFIDYFGSKLSDLPADKHEEAREWVEGWIG